MTLELGYTDLQPGYMHVNPSLTKFHMFSLAAQAAIKAVGEAMFFNGDKSNYNKIYAPSK